jgi:hypothetical protein
VSISIHSVKKAWLATAVTLLMHASPALAQTAKGEFVLTKQVHWGNVTLPPGTYNYSLQQNGFAVVFLRPAEGAPGYMLMPKSISKAEPSNPDSLLLERRGDEWFVSALTIKDLNEALLFAAPPVERPEVKHSKIASVTTP